MSMNDDIEDLEEGEITEISAFESPFTPNFAANEAKISSNSSDISPIFQTLLSQERDPLFGSSDTDLRVSRDPNVFNDCDERFLINNNKTTFGSKTNFDQNLGPMSPNIANPQEMTFSRPQLNPINPPNYRQSVENRFHSFDARPRVPIHSIPFRAPDNPMPVRMRPQMRALLPTPPFPPQHRLPIQSEPLPFRPPLPRMDLLVEPQHNEQLIHLNEGIPIVPKEWSNINPEPFVFPTNRLNPVIPFICETTVTQVMNETTNQNEIQNNDIIKDISKTQESNVTKICGEKNVKTIVLNSNDDIQEVQMQVSDADEPYDPEQDISLLCSPLSPPFVSPEKSNWRGSTPKNIPFVSNESLIESKNQNLNRSHRKKSENNDKNERLKRLLKSQNSFNENKKRRNTGKPSKKESLRMTPKVMPKFVDTMKPISTSSSKRVVHNKSCKRSHKSRRKVKRIAKRSVFTQNVYQNNSNEMNDSSYEDLLEEYQRIKQQLQELEYEEKAETIAEKDIDRQEKERIENLFKSEDIPEISNESKMDLVLSEDDDENELRRLALESKRRREMKIAEQKEAEEEEELLRQQLLQSMKAKTKLNEENNEISIEKFEENTSKSFEQNSKNLSLEGSVDKTNSSDQNIKINDLDTTSKGETPESIPKPVPKLIIHFGDDSTDDELETERPSSTLSGPLGLDSFIKQVRLRSETKPHSSPPIPVMSVTKQKELEKLKAEIARRELIQINDKKLKQNEIQWKSAKERLNEKISKQNLLKTRVILKRNALRKAQIQARKMQEAFRAATRLVSSTASEFHSFNNELKNIEKDVNQEVQNIGKFEKECIRMGLKLYGNTYKLPFAAAIKRTNSVSVSISPNKKRTKSESLSKEEMEDEKKRLVKQLENCHKLLNLKKASLYRPSSPKTILKSAQVSDAVTDKSIDSQQVLRTLAKDLLTVSPSDSILSLNCFLEKMFFNKTSKPLNINICIPESDSNSSQILYKTTDLKDAYNSVLLHLHSYRLIENQSIPISSNHWTNNLNPMQELCKFDLLGTCKDEKCLGQHFDKLLLDPYNKIVDLLLYEPKIGGITSEIPEKMDLELLDAIKQKLLQFAQKLIDSNPKIPLETHCRKITEQIRKRSNESAVCVLNRRIPKIFDTLRVEVPFDDLMYCFNIKDKNLVINQTMISELKLSADPDIYFKNRFYAPEGVPISAQLETSLAGDPHNIQLWIKLAYYHISRCADNNFADSVDRALNVLSRALDHNRSEPELYEHYLFVYSNRVLRKDEESKYDLFNICRKVVEHCPHYRVRKCVLSLLVDFNDKMKASTEVICDLLSKAVPPNDDFETLSNQILEIFCYKIRLNLEQNNIKQSILEFNKAFNKDFLDNNKETEIPYFSDHLTATDRVFGWLCFTYLLIHNNLPNHCFELSNQGFPRLIDKKCFIFDWISLKNKINFNEMKQHLNKAIEYCDISLEEASILSSNHLAIHLNYAELCLVNENDQKYYDYLMDFTQNNPMVWPSIVGHRFKSNENNSNFIEVLKKSFIYSRNDIKILLNVAKHNHKSGLSLEARNELFLIASNHYNCLISDNYLIKAYETLLFEDEENNHNFELINGRKSKESDSPIIWLSYILLLEIDGNSIKEIDFAFQTALALCSVDKTDTKDLQLLWSNYLEFCVQNMKNEKQLMDLFESVRHCCLTITDPTFQSQVIRFFCRLITINEKSKALIQFAKLIPQNLDIILTAINFGLRINKRETLWIFINQIVFDRKIRLKSLQFWKIAIGLAIDRNDHLSVHKFFQIAISLMPYNSILWQNFKIYETSVKHFEHLKQAKNICENQLKINSL